MQPTDALERIPEELRWIPSWCVAGEDKSPYGIGSKGFYRASVTDPRTWTDFETCVDYGGTNIGFVLSKNDPYVCIDLDVCDAQSQAAKGEPVDPSKWTTKEQFERYWKIAKAFNSYTERSKSGKGLHIWVRGKLAAGVRRDGVEVYGAERFIICTGDIVIDQPIVANQELLDILVAEINAGRPEASSLVNLVEVAETEPDQVIWERASNANNDQKFLGLVNSTSAVGKVPNKIEGSYTQLGYPTQSEADLALLSMFCFYTKSNAQVRRLFRQTGLGQRAKATQDDVYLNRTIRMIRSRQAREQSIAAHGDSVASSLLASQRGADSVAGLVQQMQASAHQQVQANVNVPQPSPVDVTMAQLAPLPIVEHESEIEWPPGLAGAIAGYIYQSAPRPVKEVAVVATLGLLAGICGRIYGIPQSGLNLYVILVARSGVGKEAMHSGIGAIMQGLVNSNPTAMKYVDFTEFASGPALQKAVSANSSFVNVSGEWGRKLKRLAADTHVDGPMQTLRTVMTNLYQKSGSTSIVGGINYSNKEGNIASVNGVAYSMIGETTPGTLYESLTESMMEDGFLSRFLIVEYTGERPPHNWNHGESPNKAMLDALSAIVFYVETCDRNNTRIKVGRDEESGKYIYDFDLECDAAIRKAGKDESRRQMWSRASLKAQRIAALLAVADNYLHPVIQMHHIKWAIDLVRKDISIMTNRLDSGDVGLSDTSRERKVLAIAREYINKGAPESYSIPQSMQQAGIMPRKLLQVRASRVTAFSSHKLGSSAALDMTVRSLIDSGYLMECDKAKMVEEHKYHGKCYKVLSLDL